MKENNALLSSVIWTNKTDYSKW